jgi:hypothetical protein
VPAPQPARPAAPHQPLGAASAPVNLPPLDQTDGIVRQLVSGLSANPSIAAWLTTDGLIRHFTAGVQNVASGGSPAEHARALAPARPFQVRSQGGRTVIDPRSYARYDVIAEAAASVDPEGAARVYGTLKPRIEEAYRELGIADASFDDTLERAIVLLLRTPVVTGPVEVVPRGAGYAFADPRLEDLAPAQKQLLRMGPANVQRVQTALRRIARSLGIPEDRLVGTGTL